MTEDLNSQRTEIELLKRDVSMISRLCERFDLTIDKLQQVASDISRIVSLQEQKMQVQEKINEEVEKVLEKQQKEHTLDVKELHNKINTVNSDLTTRINQVEDNIIGQMERQTDELAKKINTIDTWRYMIMGGIALAVFILGNLLDLNLAKLFH